MSKENEKIETTILQNYIVRILHFARQRSSVSNNCCFSSQHIIVCLQDIFLNLFEDAAGRRKRLCEIDIKSKHGVTLMFLLSS